MTIEERLAVKYQQILASGATVGKLVCGLDAAAQEGIHATSYDLGFASVEVEFVEGNAFGLQRITTTLEAI